MSRQDQINAELASQVPIKQQKFALQAKNAAPIEAMQILTDDEAIIIAGDIYAKVEKYRNRLENISLAIGFGGAFLALVGQNVGPLIGGVIIAYGYYQLSWRNRKSEIGEEILSGMIEAGELKIARKGIVSSAPENAPATPTNTSAFDVPPQDG